MVRRWPKNPGKKKKQFRFYLTVRERDKTMKHTRIESEKAEKWGDFGRESNEKVETVPEAICLNLELERGRNGRKKRVKSGFFRIFVS